MTIKRISFLQELLAFVGLEGRLHLEWISSAEAGKFTRVVTDFTKSIEALGPSPLPGLLQGAGELWPMPVPGADAKISAADMGEVLNKNPDTKGV